MTARTVILPNLYPLQESIAYNPARYKIVATGRRSGKTTLGATIAIRTALEYKGTKIWWVAPTNAQTFMVFEWLQERIGLICKVDMTRRRFVLANGSQIWCKSAHEPDNLLGEGIDLMLLDEAARIKNLSYVWRGVLRPMLIDSSGSMIAMSTPNRRNLFYRWFVRGRDPLWPDWVAWNFPTTENPFLPRAEFDELLQEYPPGSELYREQILGEFLESGGAVFRKVREAATAPDDAIRQAGGCYYGGIDWGKAHDFTVAVVFDSGGNMVALDRFNTVDYIVQRDRIKALHERWQVERWEVELNSIGDPNFEMLQRDGLPVRGFTTTTQSKRPLIEALAQALELGVIRILNHPILINELEAYERKTSGNTGASTYSAPSGMHDDTVMAAALAWWARQHSGVLVSFA